MNAELVRLHARKHKPEPEHPHTHTHTHALTHTYKHTQICVILIAFPQQQCFRERTTLLRYTYIVCPLTAAVFKDGVSNSSNDVKNVNNGLEIVWKEADVG